MLLKVPSNKVYTQIQRSDVFTKTLKKELLSLYQKDPVTTEFAIEVLEDNAKNFNASKHRRINTLFLNHISKPAPDMFSVTDDEMRILMGADEIVMINFMVEDDSNQFHIYYAVTGNKVTVLKGLKA